MAFPVFSLGLLRQGNHLQLKSFNQQSYDILSEANGAYKQLPFFGLQLSKNTTLHKQHLINAIRANDVVTFRYYLSQYKTDINKIKNQKIYEKAQHDITQQLQFSEEHSLENIKSKKWWQKNKQTSHYTSEALAAATQMIVPVFESFHLLSHLELERHQKYLTPPMRKEIVDYLSTLLQHINDEKKQLSEAMLSRLEVASFQKNLCYDDVTEYFIGKYKKGFHLSSKLPEPRKGLTPSLFLYFHEFIQTHGTNKQVSRIKKLSWFKNTSFYISQMIDNRLVIIPQQMMRFNIPNNTRKYLPFLFRWHNFKTNFFKNNFYFLTKTTLLDEHKYFQAMTMSELIEGTAWKNLLDLEREVVKQKNDALRNSCSILSRIFPGENKFYLGWSEFNNQVSKKILVQKINYASLLTEQLKTRIRFDLDHSLLMSEKTKIMVRQIVESIENNKSCFNSEIKNKWQPIKKLLLQLDAQMSPNHLVSSRETGSSLSIAILSTEKMLRSLSQDSGNNFDKAAKSDKNKSNNNLQQIFKLIVRDDVLDTKRTTFLKNLKRLETALNKNIGNDIIIEFWNQFFVTYLNTCLKERGANNKNLQEVHNFIVSVAPDYIKNRAMRIEEDRQSKSGFLYKTRCQALIFSFNENKKETVSNKENECMKKSVIRGGELCF